MVGREQERDGADAYGDGKDVPDGRRGSRECCGRGVGRDAPDRIGRADFGNLVSFRSTSRGDCRWPEGVVGGERPGGEHTDVEPMYR